MHLLLKYFPGITRHQADKFETLMPLYREWNDKVNVISRKDIDNLYERHILHSLAIAKFIDFKSGTTILDVGTGGGFPGIPLAIMFPDVKFHLVDSIGKKITVVQDVIQRLGLKNATCEQIRCELLQHSFDFIVSRAVTSFPEFVELTRKLIHKNNGNSKHNGIIYLKGGELRDELSGFKNKVKITELSDYFEEEFFETKKIIYLPL